MGPAERAARGREHQGRGRWDLHAVDDGDDGDDDGVELREAGEEQVGVAHAVVVGVGVRERGEGEGGGVVRGDAHLEPVVFAKLGEERAGHVGGDGVGAEGLHGEGRGAAVCESGEGTVDGAEEAHVLGEGVADGALELGVGGVGAHGGEDGAGAGVVERDVGSGGGVGACVETRPVPAGASQCRCAVCQGGRGKRTW